MGAIESRRPRSAAVETTLRSVAVSRGVRSCSAGPSGAVEREVADLAAAIDEVAALVSG